MTVRLAILGAGGHVGRALTVECIAHAARLSLELYTRDPGALRSWIGGRGATTAAIDFHRSEEIATTEADVVVNLVGAGDPQDIAALGERLEIVSREWDQKVLDVVRRRPRCAYVFASSGVATGQTYAAPRRMGDPLFPPPAGDHYARAKAEIERRHRAASGLPIYDVRIFSFVSPNLAEEAAYLASAVIRALRRREILKTDRHDIWRDYVDAEALLRLVVALHERRPTNRAVDLYSCAPASKFSLLRECEERFGLTWCAVGLSETANKPMYFSVDHGAEEIGYTPPRSSAEAFVRAVGAAIAEGPSALCG